MNDKTAGLTRFNGERKHWKTWKKQRNGYKIINEEEFEGYDGIPDPRQRDRVTAAYAAQADDPTGAEEGDNVRVSCLYRIAIGCLQISVEVCSKDFGPL